MSFDVNWDIDKYKEDHESDEHWLLRRNFMEVWKPSYPEERLVCLARVFANIEFMGCRYPQEVMQEVARMSKEVNTNTSDNNGVNLPYYSDNQKSLNSSVETTWRRSRDDIQSPVVNHTDPNGRNTVWDTDPREPTHTVKTSNMEDTQNLNIPPTLNQSSESEYIWDEFSKDVQQGPISISKVLRATYSESTIQKKLATQDFAGIGNSTGHQHSMQDMESNTAEGKHYNDNRLIIYPKETSVNMYQGKGEVTPVAETISPEPVSENMSSIPMSIDMSSPVSENKTIILKLENRSPDKYTTNEKTSYTNQGSGTNIVDPENIPLHNMDIVQSSQGSLNNVEKQEANVTGFEKFRYRLWKHSGKTHEEALVLCKNPIIEVPGYEQGNLEHFEYNNAAKYPFKNKPLRLKGAVKKRYDFWIQMGKTKQEARLIAQRALAEIPKPKPKRIKTETKRWNKLNKSMVEFKKIIPYQNEPIANLNITVKTPLTTEVNTLKNYNIEISNDDRKVATSGSTSDNREETTKKPLLSKKVMTRRNWWIDQGKSEEEAYMLCMMPMAISDAYNYIPEYDNVSDNIQQLRHTSQSDTLLSNTQGYVDPNFPAVKLRTENDRQLKACTTQTASQPKQKIHNKNLVPKNSTNVAREIIQLTKNVNKPKYGTKKRYVKKLKGYIKDARHKISHKKYLAIRSAITQYIKGKKGIFFPKYERKFGYVIVTCGNEQSRDWLDKEIPSLVLWNGAQLTVIEENEYPTPVYASLYLPVTPESGPLASLKRNVLKKKLHEQNPRVGCNKWKVLTIQNHVEGLFLNVRFDGKWENVLQSQGYKLNWYKAQPIKVKIKKNQRATLIDNDTDNENSLSDMSQEKDVEENRYLNMAAGMPSHPSTSLGNEPISDLDDAAYIPQPSDLTKSSISSIQIWDNQAISSFNEETHNSRCVNETTLREETDHKHDLTDAVDKRKTYTCLTEEHRSDSGSVFDNHHRRDVSESRSMEILPEYRVATEQASDNTYHTDGSSGAFQRDRDGSRYGRDSPRSLDQHNTAITHQEMAKRSSVYSHREDDVTRYREATGFSREGRGSSEFDKEIHQMIPEHSNSVRQAPIHNTHHYVNRRSPEYSQQANKTLGYTQASGFSREGRDVSEWDKDIHLMPPVHSNSIRQASIHHSHHDVAENSQEFSYNAKDSLSYRQAAGDSWKEDAHQLIPDNMTREYANRVNYGPKHRQTTGYSRVDDRGNYEWGEDKPHSNAIRQMLEHNINQDNMSERPRDYIKNTGYSRAEDRDNFAWDGDDRPHSDAIGQMLNYNIHQDNMSEQFNNNERDDIHRGGNSPDYTQATGYFREDDSSGWGEYRPRLIPEDSYSVKQAPKYNTHQDMPEPDYFSRSGYRAGSRRNKNASRDEDRVASNWSAAIPPLLPENRSPIRHAMDNTHQDKAEWSEDYSHRERYRRGSRQTPSSSRENRTREIGNRSACKWGTGEHYLRSPTPEFRARVVHSSNSTHQAVKSTFNSYQRVDASKKRRQAGHLHTDTEQRDETDYRDQRRGLYRSPRRSAQKSFDKRKYT